MKNQTAFQLPDFGAGDQTRAEHSTTRQLLEQTLLSRLKPLPMRPACLACDGALEADNTFQESIKVCRKCIALYAKVDSVLNERADEKARAARLTRFATEAKI